MEKTCEDKDIGKDFLNRTEIAQELKATIYEWNDNNKSFLLSTNWSMHEILPTWETEKGKVMIQGQPGQKSI
jgi:hypothetical protein